MKSHWQRRTAWRLCAALLETVLAVAAPSALAADPPRSPAPEDFVRTPVTDLIRFSPDGTRFAARVERKGQLVLVVVDFATNKGRVFNSDRSSDLAGFRWLTNDLISVSTNKLGVRVFDLSPNDFQTAFVSVDGLSRINVEVVARTLRRVPGTSADLVVARERREDYGSQILDIVDATNGRVKRQLTGDPPGQRIFSWVFDADLVARAATGYNIKTRKREAWFRDSADAKWRLMTAFDPRTERGFYPVAVDADGDLLVLSSIATGRYALHKSDRASGQPGELLVGHPRFDLSPRDLIYEETRRTPVGVSIQADKRSFYWFDNRRAEIQQQVDASLPQGAVNALQFLPNGRVLIHSTSDTEPGAYYFFDPAARSISEWTRAMPWLRSDQLSRVEVFRYKASDGLEISSYLTTPRSSSAPAPLLVWVHGGPAARDHWGFDPMVQWLASRGYAVLQPNFRGSTGFGQEFETAGHRQWGRKMQDDVTDGVRALIQQGRVDPRRICIGGASYGGYAALMGVIRERDLFRCAIDYVGVTDLIWLVESSQADYNRRRGSFTDREMEDALRAIAGDPGDPNERKVMEAHSPRLLADQIKGPVLLIYGTDDWRVPLQHGTAMRDALQAAGAAFEWKSYAGEGHGIWDRDNEVDLFLRTEAFLAKHIGPNAGR